MPKVELTNMVMIQDKTAGKVLVQERIKSWKGYPFLVVMLMKVKALSTQQADLREAVGRNRKVSGQSL